MKLWKLELHTEPAFSACTFAGRRCADVPDIPPLIARGIGEEIEPVGNLPSFSILLINPLQPVSTPQIFKLLTIKTNAPLPDLTGERWTGFSD